MTRPSRLAAFGAVIVAAATTLVPSASGASADVSMESDLRDAAAASGPVIETLVASQDMAVRIQR